MKIIKTTEINNKAGFGNKFGEWGKTKSAYIYKDLTTKYWTVELNLKCGYSHSSYSDLTKYKAVEILNNYLNK
jgi:hypothetical protein